MGPPQNRRFCGERRHSEARAFSPPGGNKRCRTCADAVALSEAESAGPGAGGRLVTAKAAENLVEWSRLSLLDKTFLLDRPRPFSFRRGEKKRGVEIPAPDGGRNRPPAGGRAKSTSRPETRNIPAPFGRCCRPSPQQRLAKRKARGQKQGADWFRRKQMIPG